MQFWFDPKHSGALRILSFKHKKIQGTDLDGKVWVVTFDYDSQLNAIIVDFKSKKTHVSLAKKPVQYSNETIQKRMKNRDNETYTDLRMLAVFEKNKLFWPDGNVWTRIHSNPVALFRSKRISRSKGHPSTP